MVYAGVNFAICINNGMPKPPPGQRAAETLRAFSGYWMAFYSASAVMLLAALRRKSENTSDP